MSMILEALRKSEAERRRGQAPDLAVELPPTDVPTGLAQRSHGRLMVAGVMLLALVLALAAAWRWLWPAPSPGDRVERAGNAPVTNTPPKPVAMPLPRMAAPVQAPHPGPIQHSRPSVAPPTEPTTATATPRDAAPPPAPARIEPALADSRVETPRSPPHDGAIRSLADLDADTRRALPPLRLSMHLWNEEPAQRLVVIDGQRLGEHDRLGDLVIQRIERDAVVLDWNGQRLRLPVR